MQVKPAVVYVLICVCLVIATARITLMVANRDDEETREFPRGPVPTERFPAGEGWEDVSSEEELVFRGGIESVVDRWRAAERSGDPQALQETRRVLLDLAGNPPTRLAVLYARELAQPGDPTLVGPLEDLLRGLAQDDAETWAGAMAAAAGDLDGIEDPDRAQAAVGGYFEFVVDVLADRETAFEPFVATYLGGTGERSAALLLATLDSIGRLHAAEFSPAVVRLLQAEQTSRELREHAWVVLEALDTSGAPPAALIDRIGDLPGPARKLRALRCLAWLPDLESAWAGIERVLAQNEDLGPGALNEALDELAFARADRISQELAVVTSQPAFWFGADTQRDGGRAFAQAQRQTTDVRAQNTRIGLSRVGFLGVTTAGGGGVSPAGVVDVGRLRAALLWSITAEDPDWYLELLNGLAGRTDHETCILATLLLQRSGRMRTRVREQAGRAAFDTAILSFCDSALAVGTTEPVRSGLAGLRALGTPDASRRLRAVAQDSDRSEAIRRLARRYLAEPKDRHGDERRNR